VADPITRVFAFRKRGDEKQVVRHIILEHHDWMNFDDEDWNIWIEQMKRRQWEKKEQIRLAQPVTPGMETATSATLKKFRRIAIRLYKGEKREGVQTFETRGLKGETDILETARLIFRRKGAK
jgi:hypothetical protein